MSERKRRLLPSRSTLFSFRSTSSHIVPPVPTQRRRSIQVDSISCRGADESMPGTTKSFPASTSTLTTTTAKPAVHQLSLTLENILDHPALFRAFESYLTRHLAEENLVFLQRLWELREKGEGLGNEDGAGLLRDLENEGVGGGGGGLGGKGGVGGAGGGGGGGGGGEKGGKVKRIKKDR
ncbi:hypothetical protein BJ684DRAFT_16231, partial [Piptocephalis cylindrospora]